MCELVDSCSYTRNFETRRTSTLSLIQTFSRLKLRTREKDERFQIRYSHQLVRRISVLTNHTVGDMTHLASILVSNSFSVERALLFTQALLLKIHATRSCAGLSLRTQELYTVVFITRYLDLLFSFISLYNTLMKIFFIMTSCSIVWFMHCHRVVRQTYDREQDTFRVVFLLIPCFLLAILINNDFTVVEVLWTFSIYLEAVAILPQLILLQRTKNIDTLTSNYVFLLGGYRSLYLLNWLYRYMTEPGYSQVIVWISGIVQTLLYCDFFYYYVQSWRRNERLSLPS